MQVLGDGLQVFHVHSIRSSSEYGANCREIVRKGQRVGPGHDRAHRVLHQGRHPGWQPKGAFSV